MTIPRALRSLAGSFAGPAPLIPYYHVVSDERLIHICHLHPYKTERQFADDIDFLCRRRRPLSLEDLMDVARRGKPLKRGGFIVTFDDGYSQVGSVAAPILFRKGVPAIFFLVSSFVDNRALGYRNKASIIAEYLAGDGAGPRARRAALAESLRVPEEQIVPRVLAIPYGDAKVLDDLAERIDIDFEAYLRSERPYLTSPQIREFMNKGFAIGAHSVDHPCFKDLPLRDQLLQVFESLEFLKKNFNPPYSLFAFPHTDRLIGRAFFREIDKTVDLTFGTSGLIVKEPIVTNLQRVNFERPPRPARSILLRQSIKRHIYRRFRDMTVQRDL